MRSLYGAQCIGTPRLRHTRKQSAASRIEVIGHGTVRGTRPLAVDIQ
jgi:hypothetical protein